MALNWKFEEQEDSFAPLKAGDYRVRISKAEETKTKNGDDMIVLTLDVSGDNRKLFYRLVFIPSYASIVNQNLQSIYDSFGIERGNLNTDTWVGKVGACKVRHMPHYISGETQAEVHYFLNSNQAKSLPVWVEGKKNQASNQAPNQAPTMPSLDDIQF